jgi:hypothetical protein
MSIIREVSISGASLFCFVRCLYGVLLCRIAVVPRHRIRGTELLIRPAPVNAADGVIRYANCVWNAPGSAYCNLSYASCLRPGRHIRTIGQVCGSWSRNSLLIQPVTQRRCGSYACHSESARTVKKSLADKSQRISLTAHHWQDNSVCSIYS